MNDYKLINSLLEDGSEASILKIKMIICFKNFDFCQIKTENVLLFKNNFYEYYLNWVCIAISILEISYKINKYSYQEIFKNFENKNLSDILQILDSNLILLDKVRKSQQPWITDLTYKPSYERLQINQLPT